MDLPRKLQSRGWKYMFVCKNVCCVISNFKPKIKSNIKVKNKTSLKKFLKDWVKKI